MDKNKIFYILNNKVEKPISSLITFANPKTANSVKKFHNSIPNYTPTPLVSLEKLAKLLNIKQLFIKDESHRFDLNAFKILGASYAIAKHLATILKLKNNC